MVFSLSPGPRSQTPRLHGSCFLVSACDYGAFVPPGALLQSSGPGRERLRAQLRPCLREPKVLPRSSTRRSFSCRVWAWHVWPWCGHCEGDLGCGDGSLESSV